MKLYKNTLIISIFVLIICVLLSVYFEFYTEERTQLISFSINYSVGIACSVVVVIITTYLQFKFEQRKILSSVLSELRFIFFHSWMVAMSLNSDEETPKTLWKYHYDEIYDVIKKTSSGISQIEWIWFQKKKETNKLNKAIIKLLMDMVKGSDKSEKDCLICLIENPALREAKEIAFSLSKNHEHYTETIESDFNSLQKELKQWKSIKD